jgi:glycine/D-amino acid oxidase-like deaminating enzyme
MRETCSRSPSAKVLDAPGSSTRYAVNKSRMLRLADYSRTSLAAVREETSISYDERMQGTLQLFREQAQLDACAKDVKALAADGVPFEVVDRDGCIRVEPALTDVRHKIVGGLLTPKDETGDCFKFATALAAKAEDLGARFVYSTNSGPAALAESNDGLVRFDPKGHAPTRNRGRGIPTLVRDSRLHKYTIELA